MLKISVSKIFVDEGEQNPLHFGYVNSYLCYNSSRLLLVLVSDAALPVNLQSGVIISYIMRYQSQHPEKNCWPSNGHCTLHLFNKAALYMCKYLPAEFWAPFLHISLCSWKVMFCSYYVMRFVCFIIILNQMFHFSSPSEISPINRCIVLYGFVAGLVMVKLCL